MSTTKYTPYSLSQYKTRFSVPLYQRLFAWGIPQVKRLLEDLTEHFAKYPDTIEGDSHHPYYLGMLTCIDNENYRDLIDGQQRFTIMILLAIVLRDYCPKWNDFLLEGERLYFKARTEDENYLKQRCKPNCIPGYTNPKMEEAILFIKQYLENHLLSDSDKELFAERVFYRLTVFITMLPEEYSKHPSSLNKYFEAMNATGKSLEQHEILKVNLLNKVQDEEERRTKIWNLVSDMGRTVLTMNENDDVNTFRNKYKELIDLCREGKHDQALCQLMVENDNVEHYPTIAEIQPQKQKFSPWSKEDKEESVVSFSEFLLLVLDVELSSHHQDKVMSDYDFYRTDHLIDRFDLDSKGGLLDYFNSIENQMSFYHRLLFYRLLLDYYVIRRVIKNGIGDYTLIYRTKKKDSIMDAADDTVEVTSFHLKQYESMLFVSTEYYRWLKQFLLFLEQNKNTTAETKLNELKNIDKSLKGRDVLPPLANLSYKEIDRYWFWKLDYCLWERYNDESLFQTPELRDAVKAYVFRANRSIEHLHPQEQSHNTIWDEDVLNSFGNLAMISQSFNSTQSNENVDVKFARIKEQIENKTIQSIKMLLMYIIADFDSKKWNEVTVDKHANEMYKILEQSML